MVVAQSNCSRMGVERRSNRRRVDGDVKPYSLTHSRTLNLSWNGSNLMTRYATNTAGFQHKRRGIHRHQLFFDNGTSLAGTARAPCLLPLSSLAFATRAWYAASERSSPAERQPRRVPSYYIALAHAEPTMLWGYLLCVPKNRATWKTGCRHNNLRSRWW